MAIKTAEQVKGLIVGEKNIFEWQANKKLKKKPQEKVLTRVIDWKGAGDPALHSTEQV